MPDSNHTLYFDKKTRTTVDMHAMTTFMICSLHTEHLHTDLFGNAAGFYSFILVANARGYVLG